MNRQLLVLLALGGQANLTKAMEVEKVFNDFGIVETIDQEGNPLITMSDENAARLISEAADELNQDEAKALIVAANTLGDKALDVAEDTVAQEPIDQILKGMELRKRAKAGDAQAKAELAKRRANRAELLKKVKNGDSEALAELTKRRAARQARRAAMTAKAQ